MTKGKKYDAIIIGAGVIGAAIAFELGKKGWKTLNIDKLSAAGAGSTINTCANVRYHYSTWEGSAMAYESGFYWDNWIGYLDAHDESGYAEFVKCGCVIMKGEAFNTDRSMMIFDEIGVPYENWSTEALKAKLPYLDPHAYYPPKRPEDPDFWDLPVKMLPGAVFTPTSGYINDAQLSVHNLQRAAEAKGGTFSFNEEVIEIRKNEHQVLGVTLKSGVEIDSPVVVNAAGPHSFVINRLAGVEESMQIKTKSLRHEVHFVTAHPMFENIVEQGGKHLSDNDNMVYCRPETGNKILIGSEDPECDQQEWVDPDEFYQGGGGPGRDNKVTDSQFKAQVYRMAKRLPDLKVNETPTGIVDLYDVSDDWLPIYDKSDLPGFYMAVGTSGNQYKNAPVVGIMMAELIEACEKGQNHDKTPVQITCKYTNLTLDVGFYSRLREINPDSSYSVLG